MGKKERRKGQRGERLAVQALQELFAKASRDLNDVYKKEGIDLLGTGNLAVQVKHYYNHVPLSKFKEIQPSDDRIRCLISWPTNRKDKPLVIFTLEDFIAMAKNPDLIGVDDA